MNDAWQQPRPDREAPEDDWIEVEVCDACGREAPTIARCWVCQQELCAFCADTWRLEVTHLCPCPPGGNPVGSPTTLQADCQHTFCPAHAASAAGAVVEAAIAQFYRLAPPPGPGDIVELGEVDLRLLAPGVVELVPWAATDTTATRSLHSDQPQEAP